MDRTDRLILLFHRRWAVPVLAELERSGGGRFVALRHALDVSPNALRQTLDRLIELGWVERNPGYGHPLRPEYVLTARGRGLAPGCARLEERLRRRGLLDVGLKKWSMPTLHAAAQDSDAADGRRFADIAQHLRTATDRAVSLALKDLTGAGLVRRQVIDGFPPGAAYRPTGRGLEVAETLVLL